MTGRPEFHRPLAADLAGNGLAHVVVASAAECAALTDRLGVPAVLALDCAFRLERGEAGRIVAVGELRARLVRECVVSLELFEAEVSEAFRVVFVPAGSERDDVDPESDDEIGYADGAIDLGEAAAEQLALGLDPYPHKPGEILPDIASEPAASPFALLARRGRPN